MFPVIFIAWFIWKKQWKAAITSCATIVGATVALSPWLPAGSYEYYFKNVAGFDTKCYAASPHNQSILGFFSQLIPSYSSTHILPPSTAAYILAAALMLVISLAVFFVFLRYTHRDHFLFSIDYEWSVLVIVMLLFSPLTWEHSFLFLCLPFAAIVFWGRYKRPEIYTVIKFILAAVFILINLNEETSEISPLSLPFGKAINSFLAPVPIPTIPALRVIFSTSFGFYGSIVLLVLFLWFGMSKREKQTEERQVPQREVVVADEEIIEVTKIPVEI